MCANQNLETERATCMISSWLLRNLCMDAKLVREISAGSTKALPLPASLLIFSPSSLPFFLSLLLTPSLPPNSFFRHFICIPGRNVQKIETSTFPMKEHPEKQTIIVKAINLQIQKSQAVSEKGTKFHH